jgi:acyl-CoA synthetase (AMP-forming)/AMP-acid ligase II
MTVRLTAPPPELVAIEYRRGRWWPSAPLRESIERVADVDGGRVALIDNDSTWTYSHLQERIERSIGSLLRAGVPADDPVVIVARNSNDSAAALLAVLRCGGVAVLLDRRCGPLDLANAVATSGARHVVAPGDLVETLRIADHDVGRIALEELALGDRIDTWAEPDPYRARIVVFTSGTTRRAKGVIHSLSSISSGVDNFRTAFDFDDYDRPYLSTPLGSITGVLQLLLSTNGGSLILEDRFDANRAIERIAQHQATVLGGAPVILELLFDAYEKKGRERTPLQRITLGGTMIPRSVLEVAVERYGIRPTRVYGSSEVPVHTASGEGDALEDRLSDDGFPLHGSECRLGAAHDGGHELEVRGPNMFLGYLHEEDNEEAFRDGWFRTGDLVEISAAGRIRVLGRLKDVVARKGLKVALAEVDDAALLIEGALEAAAYGVPDDETGERVVLAVRTADGAALSYRAVSGALLDIGLAKGKLPEEIVYWDEPLPRNATGKIVRSELAGRGAGRPRDTAPRLASPTN